MARFTGVAGKRLLAEALGQQQTLGCSSPVISKIAKAASLKHYAPNKQLIIQDADDNRLAFILRGSVDILIKGLKVARRGAGEHVGEMSVIDPKARRSATVITREETDVAWIEEKDFSKIAQTHPELWRALAVEIADRLRQRGALVRDRNSTPEIFIGSSTESLKVVRAVEKALEGNPITLRSWKSGVFGASEATIESLEKLIPRTDFAILILTADDGLQTRHRRYRAPRDNVIFELGLFIGAIGRPRTFMLVERRPKLRLPPDLSGVTYLSLDTTSKAALKKSVMEAAAKIQKRISELGPK